MYRTDIQGGIVQHDSAPVAFSVDEQSDDGLIDSREWAKLQQAGTAQPSSMFATSDGTAVTGTLYSADAYREQQDITPDLMALRRDGAGMGIDAQAVCYLWGTMIATPDGQVAVQDLRPGDLVLTLDDGAQPLIWTGMSHISSRDLDLAPNQRPVRVAKGALGNGLPRRDVDISPQHRILIADDEQHEFLISARHLMMAGLPGVSLRPLDGGFDLVHLACARYQVLLAEGAPMESFFTGRMALRALSIPQRLSLMACFPEIAVGINPMTPARPFIKHRDFARISRQRLSA